MCTFLVEGGNAAILHAQKQTNKQRYKQTNKQINGLHHIGVHPDSKQGLSEHCGAELKLWHPCVFRLINTSVGWLF